MLLLVKRDSIFNHFMS